ncbi:hypothetical protein GCM10009664_69230 [Kitasatospora gansuensis]
MFEEELREQLDQARLALAAGREAGDDEGVEAYQGRITALIRIAAHHGIVLPHSKDEEVD